MDKPDGFWNTTASSDKGWKTRRAQQDAYRRALDQQIQERKALDTKRMDKVKVTEPDRPSTTPVADPVRHLMPWLNPGDPNSGPSGDNQARATSYPGPDMNDAGAVSGNNLPPPTPAAPLLPPAGMYGSAQMHSSAGYAYPQPQHASTVAAALSGNTPGNSNAPFPAGINPAGVPASVQHHPQRNVAYGYYNTPTIPPPPAGFMQNPYVQMAPGYLPYNPQAQVAQSPMMVPNLGPQMLPPAGLPPPEEVPMMPAATLDMMNQSLFPSNNAEEAKSKMDSGRSQESNFKRHVSQTSEDGPDASQLKYDYRDDLRRQIEERRKYDDDRKNQEKLEEELLQQKVREDQERMRREYEEEEHRRRDKEEEKRKQELAILQRTKEVQEEEKARRKLQKENQRRVKAKKAEIAEYEQRTPIPSNTIPNAFDDTPLPSLLAQKLSDKNDGDNQTKHKHINDDKKDPPRHPLPLQVPSYPVEFEDHKPTPRRSFRNTKNSARKLAYPSQAQLDTKCCGGGDGDMKLCPRCVTPYSTNDSVASSVLQVHRSRSLEEQDEGLKFFSKLRSSLEAERQRLEENLQSRVSSDEPYICSITFAQAESIN